MPIEYSQEKDLTEFVDRLTSGDDIAELSPLRDHKIKVLACFLVDTDESGETKERKGDLVVLKKVGDVERTFMEDKAQFILVVDNGAWNGWNDEQRAAHLYDALISISVEKTAKGIKIKRVPPDVRAHTESVARFGAYNKPLQGMVDAFTDKSQRLHLWDIARTGGHAPEPAPEPEPEESHIRTGDEEMQESAEPPGPRKPKLKPVKK